MSAVYSSAVSAVENLPILCREVSLYLSISCHKTGCFQYSVCFVGSVAASVVVVSVGYLAQHPSDHGLTTAASCG